MSSPFRPTVTHLSSMPPEERRRRLRRSAATIFGAEMRAYACRVLEDVAGGGDEAVAAYTARWDGVELAGDGFAVRREEIEAARDAVDGALLEALEAAIGRVRRFNEWLLPPEMATTQIEVGITTGVQYRPCRSAGLYVPSGKGSFPSMLISMGTPAVVAGVERIAVVLPPRPDGSADPAVLVAADLLGIRQIFRCNGAAGIAALAVGTATIPRTELVGGPGSPVIAAVQQAAAVFGTVPLAVLGPSEAIVLADATADPATVVVDLLTEAEHGADSAVMLVATDAALAGAVASLLPQYLDRLPEPRLSFARAALTDLGGLFLATDLDEALAWINSYAPEHLQLAVADPLAVARRVRHAGEILLGQSTPFAAANYAIGTPAALPTGGAALAASGVTVLSFLKATAIAGLTPDGLRAVAPVAARLGRYEGFPAHVQAITHREPCLAWHTCSPPEMPDRGVARVRSDVRALRAYRLSSPAVPDGELVRLHQNEAPDDWPEDLKREIADLLTTLPWHRYPAARAEAVCESLGRMQGTSAAMVAATAGSNEALAAAFAAFAARGTVVMPSPTYSMAPILAVGAGARVVEVALGPRFALDAGAVLRAARAHRAEAIYMASPNNPTGGALAPEAVAEVLDGAPGAVVLDEAYWEFAKTSWLESIHAHPHLVVVRTFSKALAGAGLRVGWITAQAPLVAELLKVLPPYNLNVFAQVAVPVLAARRDVAASRVRAIVAERDRVGRALLAMGARVYPSETNFLLFEPGRPPADVHRKLAERGVLVRDVSAARGLAACLRVSIGTSGDNDRFLGALADVLKEGP